jgi:hypothetical protein
MAQPFLTRTFKVIIWIQFFAFSSARAVELLETLASSQQSLDSETAATMAVTLERLTSDPQTVSPATINGTLSVASLLTNRTTSAGDRMASAIVSSLSNAVTAGALGGGRLPSQNNPFVLRSLNLTSGVFVCRCLAESGWACGFAYGESVELAD